MFLDPSHMYSSTYSLAHPSKREGCAWGDNKNDVEKMQILLQTLYDIIKI